MLYRGSLTMNMMLVRGGMDRKGQRVCVGYLPEKDSEVAANLMDAGKSFYAVVTTYVLFLKKLRNSYRIDIAVYTED